VCSVAVGAQHTLQHTATHCNTLQHTATYLSADVCANLLWHVGVLCRTRSARHTATHCTILHHTRVWTCVQICPWRVGVCCVALRSATHTASHYNTLQHTAAYCNIPQCRRLCWSACGIWVCCVALGARHTASHWNTLQHTAAYCNIPECRRLCWSSRGICECGVSYRMRWRSIVQILCTGTLCVTLRAAKRTAPKGRRYVEGERGGWYLCFRAYTTCGYDDDASEGACVGQCVYMYLCGVRQANVWERERTRACVCSCGYVNNFAW